MLNKCCGPMTSTTTILLSNKEIFSLFRYETPSLRLLCESQLVGKVADSTVFLLLQVADRYSSCRKLKVGRGECFFH